MTSDPDNQAAYVSGVILREYVLGNERVGRGLSLIDVRCEPGASGLFYCPGEVVVHKTGAIQPFNFFAQWDRQIGFVNFASVGTRDPATVCGVKPENCTRILEGGGATSVATKSQAQREQGPLPDEFIEKPPGGECPEGYLDAPPDVDYCVPEDYEGGY